MSSGAGVQTQAASSGVAQGVTVAPVPAAKPSRAYTNRGSSFAHSYGKRTVKAYPVTDSDIRSIGALSGLAAAAFSIGTGLAGFAFDVTESISMSTGVASGTVGFWSGIRWGFIAAAIVCYIGGAVLWWVRGSTIRDIRENTTFE